ncbi:MAG: rod shape-determining protein MreC [Anaerolineae bacterium]|nr:rod shape-determining protein MreC [Anaerolineae bacterium]MDW8172749.1 rod shape-determining protein MreC [Anaerolineae bacterium]
MRRNWRNNRFIWLTLVLAFSLSLITTSLLGLFAPVQGLLAAPLQILSGLFSSAENRLSDFSGQFDDPQALRRRVAELERQLASLSGELIQLREVASDYQRLAGLLDYTAQARNQTFVTADVIGVEQQGIVRAILINRGTRDGLRVGMPVVTELGLVGRVYRVGANASQVLLVTDQNSAISGRLQTSRAEGTVVGRGLPSGNLRMLHIPLDSQVVVGDLVVTSGLGGNFPADIVIGQVTSLRNLEFELSQEAEVISLVNFNALEFVLVLTGFEPADLSIFEEAR